MGSTPVAITGLGLVSAVGASVTALRAALDRGQSGLRRLTLFESELASEFPVGQYDGDLVADFASVRRKLGAREIKRLSRSDLLALCATAQAVNQSGLADAALSPAGVYLGHSVCGTNRSEAYYIDCFRRAQDGREQTRAGIANLMVHEAAQSVDAIAREYGLCGPSTSLMTACSSGANAIGRAAWLIRQGRADVMIAGGTDSLSRITLNGFNALQLVASDGPRPFDAERKGMTVGEGAGVLVLESLDHARKRGAKILALLSGYGHSCDAHHLTAPHPQGAGAFAAMKSALIDAALQPGDIGYVSAHGTSTPDNDKTEALAVSRLFGEGAVPVSSTMRFFGHALAASGAIKAVVCVDAIQRRTLPQNLGLRTPLTESRLDLVREPRAAANLRHVISNSFGFGGNNAVLVFSRESGPAA
ncbi:MAG: beta-ketoacyl-[acyl-carrier-protein] synthase family protein [Planctomycetes bacterium]|nr:beta-ketoacyl-[acyl-carrier-protein] synthase family protein [Planctomycetota bacterium]